MSHLTLLKKSPTNLCHSARFRGPGSDDALHEHNKKLFNVPEATKKAEQKRLTKELLGINTIVIGTEQMKLHLQSTTSSAVISDLT